MSSGKPKKGQNRQNYFHGAGRNRVEVGAVRLTLNRPAPLSDLAASSRALAHYGIGPQRCAGESNPVGMLACTAFDRPGLRYALPWAVEYGPFGADGRCAPSTEGASFHSRGCTPGSSGGANHRKTGVNNLGWDK
jgi:hypothetical protein